MSLVDVKGVNIVPGFLRGFYGGPDNIYTILDAAGELCSGVLEIPRTGNISKIGFRTSTVTVSDAMKVSLQTVDPATGRPTGTLIHADAYGVQASVAGNTTYWVSLQNTIAVTRGDIVAPVVDFNSYVAGNLRIIKAIKNIQSNFPYVVEYTGGAWAFTQWLPNFGLEYDDDIIEPVSTTLPAVNATYMSWGVGGDPDRRGLRFSLPYNYRLSGVSPILDLDGDADIEIYDSDGVTLLATISLDSNMRGATNGIPFSRNLITPLELTKNTFYRIFIHPTTGTNIRLYTLDVTNDGVSEAMNAIDGGVNFHYTTCHGSPTAEGDSTQTLTKRPLIELILDRLDDGVAVCDFPAVTDVEKGVKFDNDAKTGTFKVPLENIVKECEQYGAGDTEFTGTYHHRHNIKLEDVNIQLR